MKKYQSIKKIDLMDRQSLQNRQSKYLQSRLQSLSRSSQKSISRDNNQYMQCLTDRCRNTKINQFNTICNNQSQIHNYSLNNSIKNNIKTYIRFKPFTKDNIMNNNNQNQCNNNGIDIIDDKKLIIDQNTCYSFDKIFIPQATQKNIYEESAKQLVKSFMNGYNGTIFAYGQTGSGKTYTMFGDDENYHVGIIPQVIDDLFTEIQVQKSMGVKQIVLSCSMFQIYKETIGDLMTDRQKDIKIKQSSNGSVQIENLTVREVGSKEDLIGWMNQGSELRKTRGTDMNQRSSRSHLIFTLYLAIKVNDFQTKMSKLNLVDLAGSEKVSKTKVSGQGLQQAIKINLSLSCLGNTIYALSRGQQHIPFRDSKLTRVLQQSLSGNSITRVIVTCSMLPSCKEETISSLKFANRIKKIKTLGSQNIKKLNQQGINKFMYQTLKVSYQNCEEKLQKIRSVVDTSFAKMSKEEISQAIKNILSTTNQEKQASQNQFLPPFIPNIQAFRSPTKEDHFMTQYYQTLSQTNQRSHDRNNSQTIDLNIQIKNLQTIVMKQQAIIQSQTIEIQQLKKGSLNVSAKKNSNEHKRTNKLKILKTNTNNIKMKSSLSQNKDGAFGKQNILTTFRQKQNVSQKQQRQQTQQPSLFSCMQWTKQILSQYSKQKRSYQTMQKQILMKQVKALGIEVSQLRKIIQQSGDAQRLSRISNSKNQLLAQRSTKQQENVLRRQLQQKDAYIQQLQKIIASKIGFLYDNSSKMNSLNQSSELRTFDLKNINNTKSISLFGSPTTSCAMSRINSAKYLHRA